MIQPFFTPSGQKSLHQARFYGFIGIFEILYPDELTGIQSSLVFPFPCIMSQETKDQHDGQAGDDKLSLHTLREEDFPWLLLWMTKETNVSLSLLLQTTRGSSEINILTGVINQHERVSLLTVYSAAFTRLRTAYALQPEEYSIQQLQLNPLILNKPVRFELLGQYADYIIKNKKAKKILWEIHHLDKLHKELAEKAGFYRSAVQDQVQLTLYEYAG